MLKTPTGLLLLLLKDGVMLCMRKCYCIDLDGLALGLA